MAIMPSVYCFAKSGDDHFYDMKRIMPFDENAYDTKNTKVFQFYKRVNAYLDYKHFPHEEKYGKQPGNPPFLKKYEQLKKMKFSNHRIWYHWGFNHDPKKFGPLVKAVRENLENETLARESESFFWRKLMENVSERNKVLLSEWAKVSGYNGLRMLSNLQRKQSNAFVTILVSIHLLGDHTTTETSVIIDRRSLTNQVIDAIFDLAGTKYAHNIKEAKTLKNKLIRVRNDPAMFLDVMAKNFTPFLYSLKGEEYNYKKRFKKMGYKMK